MRGVRDYLFILLGVATSFIVTAADFTVPPGVNILTEEQLLEQAVGNTFSNKRWTEYWEAPTNKSKAGYTKGEFLGKAYSGSWEIKDALICFHWNLASLAKYNGTCYMVALDGENATWYNTDGSTYYPRGGRIKMNMGNSNNL